MNLSFIFNLDKEGQTHCQSGRWSSSTDEGARPSVLPCSHSVDSFSAVQATTGPDTRPFWGCIGSYCQGAHPFACCTSSAIYHCSEASYLELSCPAYWLCLSSPSSAFSAWVFLSWFVRNTWPLTPKLSLDQKLPTDTSREWSDITSENLLQRDTLIPTTCVCC